MRIQRLAGPGPKARSASPVKSGTRLVPVDITDNLRWEVRDAVTGAIVIRDDVVLCKVVSREEEREQYGTKRVPDDDYDDSGSQF